MNNAGKPQSELNEETYKTNVTDQDKPKTDQQPKTLVASKTATN